MYDWTVCGQDEEENGKEFGMIGDGTENRYMNLVWIESNFDGL